MLNYPRIPPATLNILVTLSLLIGSAIFPSPALAASTITVATTADTIDLDGLCSLREAITNANDDAQTYNDCVGGSGNDTIQFNDVLGTTTILLTSTLPSITDTDGLTINGGGDITISGNNLYRIILADLGGVPVTLDSLTLTNGKCVSCSGAGVYGSTGSMVTILNSIFSNNNGVGGGAIRVDTGTLNVSNSLFSGNTGLYGGAVSVGSSGSIANITNSTFIGNNSLSGGSGSGIYSAGTLTITNSTFVNNTHPNGRGSIYNLGGTASIANSTFSGNSSSGGIDNVGAVFNFNGAMTIKNSTFSGNSAGTGSSGDIYQLGGLSTLYLYNNILANSAGGGNCRVDNGPVTGANNLIEDAATACGFTNNVSGNIVGQDPNLGPLTGSPAYFPLLAGSPAINTGNDAFCISAPVNNTSQNGVARPSGLQCDIGSYELVLIPSFADVPYSYWANGFIERLYNAGITGGCSVSPLNYCPENTVTRDQMAIFLERGIQGSSFVPPNVVPTFGDTAGNFAEDWIEALKNDGITGGCGNGNYCPTSGVTRAQMAIFLERSMHGSSFTPPNVAPTFGDTAGNFAEDWIEALKNDAITSGCGNGNYCPDDVVTRAQMAIFLVKAFNLP